MGEGTEKKKKKEKEEDKDKKKESKDSSTTTPIKQTPPVRSPKRDVPPIEANGHPLLVKDLKCLVDDNDAIALKDADLLRLLKKKKGGEKLKVGSLIKTETNAFEIMSIIGKGELGNVYKAYSAEKKESYALKTGWIDLCNKDPGIQMKVELHVLTTIKNDENSVKKGCFPRLIDKGRTVDFNFFVTDLLSHTLKDILTVMCKNQMPINSAAYLMKQTYHAITALHDLGYIHRNISPRNFAVGLPPLQRKVVIFGFGVVRPYLDENKKQKPPLRGGLPVRCSLKYCSRAGQLTSDRSRKDDYESWAYMCLEFFHSGNLSWGEANAQTAVQMFALKCKLFEALDKPTLIAPPAFIEILKEIYRMTYYEVKEQLAKIDSHVISIVIVTGATEKNEQFQPVWENEVIVAKDTIKILEEKKKELIKVIRQIDQTDKKKKTKESRSKQHRGRKFKGLTTSEYDDDDEDTKDEDRRRRGSRRDRRKRAPRDRTTHTREEKVMKMEDSPPKEKVKEKKSVEKDKKSDEKDKKSDEKDKKTDEKDKKSEEKAVTPDVVDVVTRGRKPKMVTKDGYLTDLAPLPGNKERDTTVAEGEKTERDKTVADKDKTGAEPASFTQEASTKEKKTTDQQKTFLV